MTDTAPAGGSGIRTALVTGGSSGIGLQAALALEKAGCRVYTLSRRETSAEGLCHISADVTDEAAVAQAVGRILRETGRIDILVNCAGFGISGAIEFTELKDAKKQFDVNFFGMTVVTKAVLAHMRERGSGRIVNVSSVAAPANVPFQAYYSASKAAVNSYTCALANELRPCGVTVCAVQPGDIHTAFTDVREKSFAGDEAYGGRIARSVARMEKDERGGMDPAKAGAYVAMTALRRSVKPLYAIGIVAKAECVLLRLLPCRLSNWLVGLIYAK